jgi:hypothetical protein
MSASPLKADVRIVRIDDREVPKADITYARKDVPGLPHFP